MKLAHGLILTALLAAGPVLAQTPVDRLQFQVPINPAVGGWGAPATNLGSITFDFIPDRNRPVVAGQWQFQKAGVATDVFFQSNMTYATEPESIATGIIASFDSPTFTFTGRSNYVDPVYGGGGTAVMTGRTIRMEFTSSRVGTFIDNPGRGDERRFPIVATLRGAPLAAPVNFAGDWAALSRLETQSRHEVNMAPVLLIPFDGPETYNVVDKAAMANRFPYGNQPPLPGARRYKMFCGGNYNDSVCNIPVGCGSFCEPGTTSLVLWINPNEVGGVATMTAGTTTTSMYDIGNPDLLAYGDTNQIIIRGKKDNGVVLTEWQFVRLATGIFLGN